MPQTRCCPGLAQEALARRFAVQKLRIDHLQGDIRPEIGVESFVGNTHRAPTKFPQGTVGVSHDNKVFELICLAHTPRTTAHGSLNLLGFVDIKSVRVHRLRIPENLARVIRDKFVPCQDKFRIKTVRRRFVNCLPGEISLQSIFIIVVGAGPVCAADQGPAFSAR